MAEVKIGLVQMRAEKGAIAENIAQIAAQVAEGVKRGLDFLCFPEMSITGYINPTRQPEAILRLDSPEIEQVVRLTRDNRLVLIAGLVEANPAGKPFITQIVAQQGRLVGYYRKLTIIDEEAEWFAPGEGVVTFEHPGTTYGLAICADIENAAVFSQNKQAGARLVFEAAAPGLYGAQENRNWQSGFEWWRGECMTKLARYASDNQLFIAVATQAGRTVDEDFPGGGYVFGPDGQCLAATLDWQEGVLYADLALDRR